MSGCARVLPKLNMRDAARASESQVENSQSRVEKGEALRLLSFLLVRRPDLLLCFEFQRFAEVTEKALLISPAPSAITICMHRIRTFVYLVGLLAWNSNMRNGFTLGETAWRLGF